MSHTAFAQKTTEILRGQGHYVRLSEGETPILNAVINGQQIVGFCFHGMFEVVEVAEVVDHNHSVFDRRNFPVVCEEAAELMIKAAQDMAAKKHDSTASAA